MLIAIAAAALAVPPLTADATTPTRAAGEVASQRQEIVRRGAGNQIFLTAIAEAPLEAERRMTVAVERLARRAGLDERGKAQLALRLLNSPAYVAARDESNRKVDTLFERIESAGRAGNERELCRTLVDAAMQLPSLSATAERQRLIMEQAIAAEARRHGVASEQDVRQASLR